MRVIIKYFKWVISPEFLFGLYLVAGNFKEAVDFIPVDLTFLLLAATVIAALFRLFKANFKIRKAYLAPMIAFFIIQIIAVGSLLYAPIAEFTFEKTIRFLIISSWCFFGSFFLIKDKSSVWKIISGVTAISVLMAINTLLTDNTSATGFTSAFGSNYLALARTSAIGSLVFVSYFIFSNSSHLKRGLALIIGLLLTIPLMEAGGRLSVFVFALIIFSLPFMMIKIKKNDILIKKKALAILVIVAGIGVFGTYLISEGHAEALAYRVEVMFTEQDGGDSLSGRTERLSTGIEMATNSYFVGMGINSFPVVYNGIVTDTPHVIYVELLAELGLIALLAFLFIVALAFYRMYKTLRIGTNKLLVYTALILTLFLFVNSLGSSSLISSKIYFAFLGIALVMPYIINKDVTHSEQTTT